MPTVWIPPLMQKLTEGKGQIEVSGTTMRRVIEELEASYPGMRARLVNEEEDKVRTDIAVAVDGEISREGLRRKVGEASEIHFLPAMSGGRGRLSTKE
jgi:molybdopterin synthase sulfur carrier subunit